MAALVGRALHTSICLPLNDKVARWKWNLCRMEVTVHRVREALGTRFD